MGTHARPRTGTEPEIRSFQAGDIDGLVALETAGWHPSLRATEATIRRRLDLGHDCIVADYDGAVICAASFVLTAQDPHREDRFPATFEAFSSLPRTRPTVSAYVYSLCVDPEWRGQPWVFRVIDAVLSFAREAGASYVVGDGRCPSYNGTTDREPDEILCNPAFQATIRHWHTTGIRPCDTDIIADPVLRFYRRYTGCRFLYLRPGFLPQDQASGGYRVIFAVDLNTQRV